MERRLGEETQVSARPAARRLTLVAQAALVERVRHLLQARLGLARAVPITGVAR